MGCAAMPVGRGLGKRVQERVDTGGEGLKQAKRAFLHVSSPVLPKRQGLSLSQQIGVLWKFTACTYYYPATRLDPVSQP